MHKPLTIAADENIPLLDELLGDIAHIIRLPGRTMTAAQIRDADALLVRSVTSVNSALLQDTAVRFVGTCTIGVDHIDQHFLAQQNIGFSSAPGCNAAAVVDYVMAALLAIEPDISVWQQRCVGIVGYGEVGSRLYQRLQDNGIAVRACDPFKSFASNTLDEVLACDAVSLHVPLTRDGAHPTLNLLNQQRLQQLPRGSLLINTSRGKVVDNAALLACLQNGQLQAVLDVYQDEPEPQPVLLDALDIATAHIAGYSLHGKMRGTLQVIEPLYRFFAVDKTLPEILQQYNHSLLVDKQEKLDQTMLKAYDIRKDSAAFIQAYKQAEISQRAAVFDAYRKHYQNRYELAYLRPQGADAEQQRLLTSIGFGRAFTGAKGQPVAG